MVPHVPGLPSGRVTLTPVALASAALLLSWIVTVTDAVAGAAGAVYPTVALRDVDPVAEVEVDALDPALNPVDVSVGVAVN
jgi:hypothetical protein